MFGIYWMLEVQPELDDSSQILKHFHHIAKNGHIGTLINIENALANGQLTSTSSSLASLTPQNDIESNYIDFYKIYIHYRDSTYSVADSIKLKTLVDGCPVRDGMVIQQARALYSLIYRDFTIHFDDCPQSATAKSAKQNNTPLINVTNRSFNLYPNPNNGNMILDYNLGKDEKGELAIYDISGKMLASYILSSEQKTLTISKTALNSGVYYYSIIVNNVILETRKLVILK